MQYLKIPNLTNSILGVELNLNESLPPEQYREPVVDKNQKMKQQLEVRVCKTL